MVNWFSRLLPLRRWFQFSLRGLLALTTATAVWLGWRVERARQRERAIDAIVEAGGFVNYDSDPELWQHIYDPSVTRNVRHYWADFSHEPVSIHFGAETGLNESIGKHLSCIHKITRLKFFYCARDADLKYLYGIDGGCSIDFYDMDGIITKKAVAEFQRRMPNATVRLFDEPP